MGKNRENANPVAAREAIARRARGRGGASWSDVGCGNFADCSHVFPDAKITYGMHGDLQYEPRTHHL